jgi:hypothetical protein
MEKTHNVDDHLGDTKLDSGTGSGTGSGHLEVVDNLEVPVVTWWKHPGLRKLYAMMPILLLGATINGYDGSLLNGLQTMDPWQECKWNLELPSNVILGHNED